MEHDFMKVIYSYRQQRDFEQKIQHLSVLFPHIQCLICLSISFWIWWYAANLHCCDAANKSVNQTFSKTSSFQTFFLKAADHLFTAVWETLQWFDYHCLVVPLCISIIESWEWGMQRGNRFTVFQWRKEGTQNCCFAKGPSIRECHLMPLFSPQCLPPMVCHTYPKCPPYL